jgi:chromosome segregation ATPase
LSEDSFYGPMFFDMDLDEVIPRLEARLTESSLTEFVELYLLPCRERMRLITISSLEAEHVRHESAISHARTTYLDLERRYLALQDALGDLEDRLVSRRHSRTISWARGVSNDVVAQHGTALSLLEGDCHAKSSELSEVEASLITARETLREVRLSYSVYMQSVDDIVDDIRSSIESIREFVVSGS